MAITNLRKRGQGHYSIDFIGDGAPASTDEFVTDYSKYPIGSTYYDKTNFNLYVRHASTGATTDFKSKAATYSGNLTATITESVGHAALSGATVTVKKVSDNTTVGTPGTTNGSGVAVISDLPDGTYYAAISKALYTTQNSSNFTITSGSSATKAVELVLT